MTFDKLKILILSFFILLGLIVLLGGCSKETGSTVTLTLDVEPTSMQRETVINVNPEPQKVVVTNPAYQSITFSAIAQESWVRVSIFGGGQVVDRMAPDSFVISISSRTLPAGYYVDTVWVTSNEVVNSPVGIEVTLLVGDYLEVTPDSLVFNAITFRESPPSQSFNISSVGGVEFDYSLTQKSSWLNLPSTTGTAPEDLDISTNSTGLIPGYYYDTITIDAPLAVNSPFYVPTTLSVLSWEAVDHPFVDQTTLNEAFFIDDMHGWVVGYVNTIPRTGYIIATDDGGENWVVQELDALGILGDVIFNDLNTGFVCGEGGVIRKTTNGGDYWLTKRTPDSTDHDLLSISFADNNNGWICGDSGKIYYTSDAGETWVNQTSNVDFDLSAIDFVSSDSGWVVGNAGTILFTDDGGDSWVIQTSPGSYDLRDVYFKNNTEGWAVGLYGTILHTTNSGGTWDRLITGLDLDTEYRSISFCSCGQGWIVGNNGTILYSTNGISWVEQLSGTGSILQGIYMISNTTGWAVGHEGTILYTEVGGH
ncbi:MAG: YCF48-related protein [bacterium]